MADDVIFQEAVDALRGGNKAHARELLTGLIKNDQNNVDYWIWLSAAMETSKERVYCLQTAFKLDPENATAKRGLILLGALPADETIQPFQMNRPRAGRKDFYSRTKNRSQRDGRRSKPARSSVWELSF